MAYQQENGLFLMRLDLRTGTHTHNSFGGIINSPKESTPENELALLRQANILNRQTNTYGIVYYVQEFK